MVFGKLLNKIKGSASKEKNKKNEGKDADAAKDKIEKKQGEKDSNQ